MMNIENRDIATIRPYERNPRKNDKAVEAVARSIQQFGWRQPLVVDGDGCIIVGHTRYQAAKFLGLTSVPVHVADNLTPEQVKAYRIADNKLNELAEWDEALLAHELNILDGSELDMSDYGFNSQEIARLLDPNERGGTEGEIDRIPQRYEVTVECRDEAHQKDIYERLTGEGLTCRVMTV